MKYLNADKSRISCDFEYTDTEEFEDEAGNQCYKATMVCQLCALQMNMEAKFIVEGCTKIYHYEYTVVINGVTLVEKLVQEQIDDSHQNTKNETIQLSDYGCCGGSVTVNRCTICETITHFEVYSINCSMGEEHYEDILDAQGNTVGYQYIKTCTECGLVYIYKQWKENGEQCSYTEYTARYLYKGTDCIISSEQVGHYTSHQWEYSYEMYGDSCEDGYHVNRYCTVCGETYSYDSSGHRTQYREVSLREFGLCDGYIREEYCRICNMVTYAYANDWCDFYDMETNAEGYMVYECEDCGAFKHIKETRSAKDEACWFTTERTVIYFQGGEVYRYTSQSSGTSHVYEYEFILQGASCNEGVKVNKTCRDCDYYYQQTIYDHENYRIFSLDAVVECAHRHELYFSGCPCGKYYNMNISSGSFGFDEEQGMYVCADCGVSVMHDTQDREEGCQIVYTDIYLVKQGDRILYQNQREQSLANHSYAVNQVANVNGSFVITSTCDRCLETSTSEIGNVELEYHDGNYYYDYTFIPGASGLYTITGLADRDSYVTLFTLVDGNLVEIDYNDDGGYSSQFSLSANLTAGTTYIYRIRFYNTSNSGNISFALTQGESEHEACDHEYYQWFTVLLDGSNSCTDGALYGRACENCGCVISATTIHEHNAVQTEIIDLEAQGACYGSIVGYSCACGQNSGYQLYDSCYDEWTSNEYYDEQGRLVYVNTYMCYSCDLRYTISSYFIENTANCTQTTYYTMVVSIGERLVTDREFNVVSPSHDYAMSNVVLQGTSCDDGATVTFTCNRCGDAYTDEITYHKKYETQRIHLSNYGCVCGGYASVYTCACGQYTNLELQHTLCEWNQSWREPWIDGIVTEGRYTIDGWNSFWNDFYVYTCAVTDPTACAYQIRYGYYWLKDEDQCMAYRYETW